MGEQSVLIQVRLPEDLVRALDHLAIDEGQFRSVVITELLREALERRTEARDG